MKTLFQWLLVGVMCTALGVPPAMAADTTQQPFSTAPKAKAQGKWRIGYYEGGQHPDHEVILKAIVRGLVNLHWLNKIEIPAEDNPTPGGFWAYLAHNAVSDYIEFVPDAYYNAGDFDPRIRPQVRERLIKRLSEQGDIDLMIAMGTWAGQDLANDRHHVATVVAAAGDPIGSGIVKSAEDSGLNHLYARVEPDRHARQVELFHDIIGFRRLGVVFEDTPEGHARAAVDIIERTAATKGFEVVKCSAPFSDVPREAAENQVVACYEKIAMTADAVYLTMHHGLNARSLPQVVTALIAAQRPSFSMLGESEVKRGVLVGMAQGHYRYVGYFHAEHIARIFNGAQPRLLSQVWLAPARIALNLKTAELVGYDPSVDILLACDEIYSTIEQ
ncbi:MAG: ABC transporter substrate binding protein [Candidatus Contendobacter sp.]|nr:ABC transporter substrate binding protein [Candidatus Contendobacter sp.]